MKFKKLSVSVVFLVVVAMLIAPLSALAAQPSTTGSKLLKNVPVSGTLEDGGTFNGKLSINELNYDEVEGLVMSGVLKGNTVDADGNRQNVNETFTDIPATLTEGTDGMQSMQQHNEEGCDILFLDLGPIFLDVLGLQVDLSQIVLDITAVPGPGNLLGNLLCQVAGLLDSDGLLNNLLGELDDLLGQLDGLLGQINNLLG